MEFTSFQELHRNISARLLKSVFLTSVILALITSSILITFDTVKTRKEMVSDAFQLLNQTQPVTGESSHQATRVINRLLSAPFVIQADFRLPDGDVLVQSTRKTVNSSPSWFTQIFLGKSINYQLSIAEPKGQLYGYLNLEINSDWYGSQLEWRSLVTLISGLALSLLLSTLLFLISPWLFNKQQLKSRLNHLFNSSEYDYVTRLPTERCIQKKLEQLIGASSDNQLSAVLCLGLDDFKPLRAELSFDDAEHTLIKVADRLRGILDEKHYLGRLGEDRFLIIMEQLEEPFKAAELAQKLITRIKQPFQINNKQLPINATVGITLFPEDSCDVDELIKQADFSMMLAKSRSQGRYQFYIASIDSEIRQKKRLEQDLHDALSHHELNLVYQPQVDYQSSLIVGVEVLLRWQHPEQGLILPADFIPMAENNLDIIPIGDWVLESACHQLHNWHQAGYPDLRISVNLSVIQLKDKNITNRIQYLLRKYNIPPHLLELEVTESSIMEDSQLASDQLQQIKALGIKLSLDDFGTGYSSLSYLKQFPFDKIKIDKSFIEGLPENKENSVIVDAIIQLGNSFGLPVIAEGVESGEQEQHLIQSGCHEGQGFLYGKPMSSSDLNSYLQSYSHSPHQPKSLQF
ncbi:GGDEF-domain containing protein [Endozoicomonas sp. OPT23]|uniref:putative bifunctional diguanylate cyclase/phosphodiesterase n=1 Tax=Endozoicomonas sp. OPT23 TaxID=2072845 RepID=UPI00129A7D14|nr:bifunctional diguanylate cyclase/phosphodiesterase [Endozoicomonas sp. OPT23]MRI32189.1 GGDEF-domain containing protein [Endozoicomonas sp. OPT23]